MLDKQRSSSTIKVYTAARAASMPLLLADRWAKILRFFLLHFYEAPGELIPRVLVQFHFGTYQPFEPLQSSSLRVLSLKTVLLLALASVKWVGDLQVLSVKLVCLEFGPNDSKVVLKPWLGYVPEVLSTPFRAHVIKLSAFLPYGQPEVPALPCQGPENIHWAFCLVQKVRTAFCWLRNRAKGGPVTKQSISSWLVDAITLAYSSSCCSAPSESEPIPPKASPRLGHGPAWGPFQTFVRRMAGPRRPHLQGFTTWMSPPCRPESCLLK